MPFSSDRPGHIDVSNDALAFAVDSAARAAYIEWSGSHSGSRCFTDMVMARMRDRDDSMPVAWTDQLVASIYDTHMQALYARMWWAIDQPVTFENELGAAPMSAADVDDMPTTGLVVLSRRSDHYPGLRAATWMTGKDAQGATWLQVCLLGDAPAGMDTPWVPLDFTVNNLDSTTDLVDPVAHVLFGIWRHMAGYVRPTACLRQSDHSMARLLA